MLKYFEYFAVPDSINIMVKSTDWINVTKFEMALALQSPEDDWVFLGSQTELVFLDADWAEISWNMDLTKFVMDSIKIIYLYFAVYAAESCYVGGTALFDDLVGINNNSQFLIDGFGDDSITGIEISEIEQNLFGFVLGQNYPNPFNPSTTIEFFIPEREYVSLIVFNSLGEEVEALLSEEKEQGSYEVKFNASDLPSGVYFYKLQAGNFVETKKMTLIK
ncbi:MAG: T9SS type A sorting domain-containing protein [Ignavibacteriales bacterium]|nr:T9SS type A sorting domain-containing protein [Ignavibacteriales bacterium]